MLLIFIFKRNRKQSMRCLVRDENHLTSRVRTARSVMHVCNLWAAWFGELMWSWIPPRSCGVVFFFLPSSSRTNSSQATQWETEELQHCPQEELRLLLDPPRTLSAWLSLRKRFYTTSMLLWSPNHICNSFRLKSLSFYLDSALCVWTDCIIPGCCFFF